MSMLHQKWTVWVHTVSLAFGAELIFGSTLTNATFDQPRTHFDPSEQNIGRVRQNHFDQLSMSSSEVRRLPNGCLIFGARRVGIVGLLTIVSLKKYD